MKELPKEVSFYKKTKVFDQDTIPGCFDGRHNTKENVWGGIHVIEGELICIMEDPHEEIFIKAGDVGYVAPQAYHSLKIENKAKLYVAFYK